MSKKLIYRVWLVLVLGLLAGAAKADLTEGLVAYWTFDDGSGTTAIDSVGGHHGTLVGGPVWTPPGDFKIGTGALHFDGADDVVSIEPFDVIGGGITLAAWMKPDSFGINDGRVISKANEWGADDHWWMLSTIASGGNMRLRFRLKTNDGQPVPTLIASSGDLVVGEWHHWAATWDGTTMRLYSNTVEAGSTPKGGTAVATDPTVSVAIGSQPPDAFAPSTPDHVVKYFHGVIDDVGVWNRALTPEELKVLWNDGAGTAVVEQAKASNPRPQNEATDVPRDVVLNWAPGVYAPAVNGHRVYFSESFNDVNDGVGGTAQDANSYDPGRLDFETTYYWRVDEVNGPPDFTVYPGDLWSLTTEPVGYPVDGANITATASSAGGADFGPEKTIDRSGLDANDLHSTEPLGMWLSGDEPQGAWIQYEFDKEYKLHQMWVWNSNQIFEGLFGFGFKEVTVEHSTNGADWTALADVPEFSQAPGTDGYAHNTMVDFGGATAKSVRLTATGNWGGVLPQYGLSEVRFFSIPVSAREPSPDAGAADVDPDVTLAWRAGREAGTHNVYLSADQQAVIDGTTEAVSVADTSYSTTLNLGNTYYWRVDEVNEAETPAIWQGDIWDFTIQEYLVVEDFEDYNDYPPYEIYSTWLDGYENPANGSQVGYLTPPAVETTIVHGGAQSMPLIYSNTGGATYSEATRTFAVGQDWTKYGIETLQLWFYGAEGNTGQLYVKINGVKVPYDGDAGNLAVAGWQPWNMDLPALGANLQSVTTLAIGIDGNAAVGTLYVDDIRLYGAPAAPVDLNLVAWWQLDDNADDSSGNGHNGTVEGVPTWVSPGRDGTGACMRFGGDSDRITVDSFDVTGTGITLSAWINPSSFMNDARMVSKSEGGSTSLHYWAMVLSGTGEDNLQFRLRTDVGATTSRTSAEGAEVLANEWTHAAVTWDASDPVMRQYKNGVEIASFDKAGSAVATGPGVQIGIGNQSIGALAQGPGNEIRPFDGLLDDVRVYDRGLSPTEIFQLASQ